MELPFEGIPTVPPRKDRAHMVRRECQWLWVPPNKPGSSPTHMLCSVNDATALLTPPVHTCPTTACALCAAQGCLRVGVVGDSLCSCRAVVLCRARLTPALHVRLQVFFCGGCRYRVTAAPAWSVGRVKQALWAGGISRSNKPPERRATPGLQRWEDLVRVWRGGARGRGCAGTCFVMCIMCRVWSCEREAEGTEVEGCDRSRRQGGGRTRWACSVWRLSSKPIASTRTPTWRHAR